MEPRNAAAAVIGAGDYIGAAIARKFALEGFGRLRRTASGRHASALVAKIEAHGGRIVDARKENDITAFLNEADRTAPLEVCIFNIGANFNFPLLETTERVFCKVWEMAWYRGFLARPEAAWLMLPRGRSAIFFTGSTASLRGRVGYSAFAAPKFGFGAVAQSAAGELGPHNIHASHLIIDAGVDTAWVRDRIRERAGEEAIKNLDLSRLMTPASVAETSGNSTNSLAMRGRSSRKSVLPREMVRRDEKG